jgi:hypothetical protein
MTVFAVTATGLIYTSKYSTTQMFYTQLTNCNRDSADTPIPGQIWFYYTTLISTFNALNTSYMDIVDSSFCVIVGLILVLNL